MLLPGLPEEVLYQILSHLDRRALGRLAQVCRATRQFVGRDAVWRSIARGLLNTGVSRHGADMLLPWLQLDDDALFLSQAAEIGAYHLHQRHGGLRLTRNLVAVFSGHRGDVCRFTLTDSHLISGGSDGRILVHNRRGHGCLELLGHNQEIWTSASSSSAGPRHTAALGDRVWSVAISPALSSFVTGTACCENFSPLRIWDVERCECVCRLGEEFRRGAGVLDMAFETPHQLYTCGYDTYIRLWDLRLSPRKCVMEWEEPHDCALYCLQTDGNHMIASGSSYYGVVRLWDKRQSQCLKFFQLTSDRGSSPVYCLRFSSSHLYAAVATALHALDFRRSAAPELQPLPFR
ncbi:hypothetical protein CRUP_005648 [Coryphaenoides rupestris]|nr:hypothetical protein CRUP_005648 [Coryphaenoides rupestris]